MAAGLVYHNLTTASGVTFTVASWVPDTGTPDVGAIPVQVLLNSSGSPLAMGSGVNGATVPRFGLATDSPGIVTLGIAATAASVPMVMNSDAIKYVTVDFAIQTTALDAGDVVADTQV